MPQLPHAFLSYARFNDEHDEKSISWLCDRLAAEVQTQTGSPFVVLRDNKDILWGERWRDFVESGTLSAALMFVIISPSYFQSKACRLEYEKFKRREAELGRKDLILPIYYVEVDEFEEEAANISDPWIADLKSRNYERWSHLRHHGRDSTELRQAVGLLGSQVKRVLKSLDRQQSQRSVALYSAQPVGLEQKPAPPEWQPTTDAYKDLTGTQQLIVLFLYRNIKTPSVSLDDFYEHIKQNFPTLLGSVGELLYRTKDLERSDFLKLRSNSKNKKSTIVIKIPVIGEHLTHGGLIES